MCVWLRKQSLCGRESRVYAAGIQIEMAEMQNRAAEEAECVCVAEEAESMRLGFRLKWLRRRIGRLRKQSACD